MSKCHQGCGLPTSSFQDLARTLGAVTEGQSNDLIVARKFDLKRQSENFCRGRYTEWWWVVVVVPQVGGGVANIV